MRHFLTGALMLSSLFLCSCNAKDAVARKHAIEESLKPFTEIEIPTGLGVALATESLSFLRKAEAAGLVRIEEVPQGYWDSFSSQTFMQGARPYKILATEKLAAIALNPRLTPAGGMALASATIASTLESSWNYYVREKIFLGPNYFGNTTSFGRYGGTAPYALTLMSDYPTYRALASRGLITLDESGGSDIASVALATGAVIERAGSVNLTPAGARLAKVDSKANTATFVFGTYKIENITKNTPIDANEGVYRLVEGTRVFDLRQEFSDMWAELARPAYREGRFRAVFTHDLPSSVWTVAIASNRRYMAEDDGSRNGEFESANVPPTVEELRFKRSNGAGEDHYMWRVHLGDLKVADVLRDEEYKGPLATPGETFRLLLATTQFTPPPKNEIPPALTSMLPARLRCVLKYSEFKKEWNVVALDVGPADSEQWYTSNVR
jgi:hypothetical protein